MIYDIGRDMFRRLVRHSMGFFESQRTGETVSRLTSDVQALQQALQGQVLNALFGLFTMVIYLVVMLTLEWRLTLIILSVVPIMLLASVVSARMLRVRYRRVQETVANINTAIEENVSGRAGEPRVRSRGGRRPTLSGREPRQPASQSGHDHGGVCDDAADRRAERHHRRRDLGLRRLAKSPKVR